jgi:hypothetical protein
MVLALSVRTSHIKPIAVALLAGKLKDFALLPNDILFVPLSGSKQALVRATEAAIGLGMRLVQYRR